MPSPNTKYSNETEYESNFIIRAHGSVDCPRHRINAIQIKVPHTSLKKHSKVITAKILAMSIYDFYTVHNFDKMIDNDSLKCI